jgi:hypothetical protein
VSRSPLLLSVFISGAVVAHAEVRAARAAQWGEAYEDLSVFVRVCSVSS